MLEWRGFAHAKKGEVPVMRLRSKTAPEVGLATGPGAVGRVGLDHRQARPAQPDQGVAAAPGAGRPGALRRGTVPTPPGVHRLRRTDRDPGARWRRLRSVDEFGVAARSCARPRRLGGLWPQMNAVAAGEESDTLELGAAYGNGPLRGARDDDHGYCRERSLAGALSRVLLLREECLRQSLGPSARTQGRAGHASRSALVIS